jgi:hypothetical protein
MNNLQYKLILKAEAPYRAVVRYGLTGRPKSFQEQTVTLDPKQPSEIHDVVKWDDFTIDRADGKEVIRPLTLEVAVSQDRANGPPLGQARYSFRMIPPQDYIKLEWAYDPIQRVLTILVIHLASDKVTGPVDVVVSIGGEPLKRRVPRSESACFPFVVPSDEKKVRWRVGIERIPEAFTGEVETPPPAPAAPAGVLTTP